MPTNYAYMTTTDDNHIPSIIGGVKSFIVDSDEPTGTKVRWLVSFDGRAPGTVVERFCLVLMLARIKFV